MAEFLHLREREIKISNRGTVLDRKSENSTVPTGVEGKEKNMGRRGGFYMPACSLTRLPSRG